MKQFFQKLLEFLETKSGFLILASLVATAGGSFLNYEIQKVQSQNSQNFEMYKTRLAEAKELQKKLLTTSTERYFYLQQVWVKLGHPEQNKPDEIQKYWYRYVTLSKDNWNKDLTYLHAQARTLFTPTLANMILVDEENIPSTLHDTVIEKLNVDTYNRTKPKSLQGAFINTHATVYYLLNKCNKSCKKADLIKLAEKQMGYLELMQSCVAYRMSSELLRYPYGPKEQTKIVMPDKCKDIVTEKP